MDSAVSGACMVVKTKCPVSAVVNAMEMAMRFMARNEAGTVAIVAPAVKCKSLTW